MKPSVNWHDHCHVATQGISFECQRCCKCCYLEVTLSYGDIENIHKINGKSMWAIIPTMSPRYPQYGEFYTIMHTYDPQAKERGEKGDKGLCALLEDRICRVYPGRPITCQIYPFSIELKKKMKEKRKLPKHAPTFLDPSNSKAYVVVFDPECPGVGKGLEVNLEQIASLELENIRKLAETYNTNLREKIGDLLCSKEAKKTHEEFESNAKVFTEIKKFRIDEIDVDLFVHIAYNPKDTNEEDARNLASHTIGIWQKTFPEITHVMVYYAFPVGASAGLIKIYVGVVPLSKDLVTPSMIEGAFSTLMVSEDLRKKSKTSVGFASVRFENGQWITPS